MPFAPSDITGLKGWWDASAITGLTDGNSVSTWADLSGNSRTLTPLASNPPTYKTGIRYTKPIVRFDGVNDVLEAASALTGSTDYTLVVVMAVSANGANLQVPIQGGANQSLAMILSATPARGIYATGQFVTYSGGTYTPGTWERWLLQNNAAGNASNLYVDNVLKQSSGKGNGAPGNVRVGAAKNTGSTAAEFYAVMDVAEIIVYDGLLTSTDRANLDAYLSDKWFTAPPSSLDFTVPEATATAAAPAPKINLFLSAPKATATALALAATLTIGNAPLPFSPPEATASGSAPVPSLVVGAFGFAPPKATGTGSAPAPSLAFGSFDVTAPAATAAGAAPAPSLNISGSPLELAIPPATATGDAPPPVLAIPVKGNPWSVDLSRRTLMPFLTSGQATSSPPIPAVPPGVVERTITRSSRVVPDLRTIEGVIVDPTTNQLRLPDDIYDALPVTEGEIGVPHIIFRNHSGAVDVTYFRGVQAKLLPDTREEPFGDKTFSFRLPGMSSMDTWPEEPGDPLFFLINRANVQIELVKSDGSRRVVWTGHIVTHRTGNSETSPDKAIQCVGTMFQAATDRMRPPTFLDPTDIGTLMSKALNAVSSRRYPLLSAPATGIMSRQRGSWADSPLAYVQGLLATAWTEAGRQWTVAKVKDSTRTYVIRLKKNAPEWTMTNGARGVSVDLQRDESTIRNVIFGHGVGPDGNAWFNYHYPNLHADTAPAYPFTDPDDVISVGTSDGETDSGHGVTDWQRRARQLGYKLAIDGVFNTSDAAVARTIQRRYGASVDGVVGPQTWNATFAVGANSGNLNGVIRLPLASDPRTQRWLFNADGSVAGANPEWNTNVLTYADDVDFGTGITREEGIASAQQIIDRESVAGLTGSIVLTQDPREGWRGDIAPGDKMTLVGYEGADRVLHVTRVQRGWDDPKFPVTLEVDEKSRDALTIAQIHARDKEARRDPARRPGNPNKRSRLDVDQVVPFDGESGAGVIPRLALFGGLWSVIRIPVSETGRVAKMHIESDSPFAIVFFGAPITPAHLRSYVGNPLNSDAPFEAHERQLDEHWFIEGFGQKGQRCGYYPGAEDRATPFTGVEEQGGFEYTSSRAPWIWVAMYAAESCFLEGYVYPDTVI